MDGELVSSSSDIRWANQYVLNSVTDADTKITAGVKIKVLINISKERCAKLQSMIHI